MRKRKTPERYEQDFYKTNPDFTLCSLYNGAANAVVVQCKKCGAIIDNRRASDWIEGKVKCSCHSKN